MNRKLKILCLHGYRQDAESFKDKMGGFRKSIKNIANLVFIDAPHVIPDECLPDQAASVSASGKTAIKVPLINEIEGTGISYNSLFRGRSWWFSSENCTFSSRKKCRTAKGFQETLAAIDEAFRAQGPFDGILGFSQGGALASLICGLKKRQEFSHNFQFVIIVGGFLSLSESHQYIYENTFNTESLHIIGKNDSCIPEELSNELLAKFHNPAVIYHEGGHYVPSHGSIRNEYVTFLKKMLENVKELPP